MSSDDVHGDLADQADSMIAAAEQEAIRAALVGSAIDQDRGDGARPDRVEDEPALDLGDGDDSDDPAHHGGDDVSTSPAGAPADPIDELAREAEDHNNEAGESSLVDE
jgi:hypothetical protein